MSADREIKVGKLFRYKGSETRWRLWTSEAFVTVVCHREESAKADIFVEQVVFVWRWIVLMPVNILVHAFVRMCRKGLPSWFTSAGTLAMEKIIPLWVLEPVVAKRKMKTRWMHWNKLIWVNARQATCRQTESNTLTPFCNDGMQLWPLWPALQAKGWLWDKIDDKHLDVLCVAKCQRVARGWHEGGATWKGTEQRRYVDTPLSQHCDASVLTCYTSKSHDSCKALHWANPLKCIHFFLQHISH